MTTTMVQHWSNGKEKPPVFLPTSNLDVLLNVGEEIDHGKSIVQVIKGISEGGVSIANDVVKREFRLNLGKGFQTRVFLTSFELKT